MRNIGLGRLFHVVKRKTLYMLIALLAVAASSVGVYYYLGYASVGSVNLALELEIFRTRAPDNTSITFHIPAMLWSGQMPLDVDVNSPSFTLEADSIAIARIAPEGGIIHSHHCLVFPLDFKTTNSSDAEFLARKALNNVVLSVAVRLTAGLYSQTSFSLCHNKSMTQLCSGTSTHAPSTLCPPQAMSRCRSEARGLKGSGDLVRCPFSRGLLLVLSGPGNNCGIKDHLRTVEKE